MKALWSMLYRDANRGSFPATGSLTLAIVDVACEERCRDVTPHRKARAGDFSFFNQKTRVNHGITLTDKKRSRSLPSSIRSSQHFPPQRWLGSAETNAPLAQYCTAWITEFRCSPEVKTKVSFIITFQQSRTKKNVVLPLHLCSRTGVQRQHSDEVHKSPNVRVPRCKQMYSTCDSRIT